MKYFIDLINGLKRGEIHPVYLFYGEESYLKEQAILRFKEWYLQGEPDMNFDLINGETTTPADIASRAETLPFFSGRRLVVVKNPTFFKGPKRAGKDAAADDEESAGQRGEAPLLEYIKNPLESTCLIFTTGDSVDKRKRVFKAIKKKGQALEFVFLSRGELARWLAQKTGAAGKKLAAGAGETLLNAAGPSLQKLVSELEKLFNYTYGREVITQDDIRQVCPVGIEENIFAIVDAVGGRRCGDALSGIRELLAAKEPPFKILSMISRQFRLLLQVRDLMGRGCPAREIPAILKIHPYTAQKIVAQCKNFSQDYLIVSIQSLSEVDLAVKTGRQEFYPAVENFLLKLCAGETDKK